MSYYYTYFLGCQKKDGKIYPLGPYNYNHDLCPVFCISASFASDLNKKFSYIKLDAASEELKNEFEFEDWNEKHCSLKILETDKMPSSDFIKKGYFLIEDVKKYENDPNIILNEEENVFEDYLTPTVYANMLNNEILLGQSGGVEFLNLFDDEENDEEELEIKHSVGEYMFYIYPDYYCEEYESFVIKQAIKNFELQLESSDDKIVVLLIEG